VTNEELKDYIDERTRDMETNLPPRMILDGQEFDPDAHTPIDDLDADPNELIDLIVGQETCELAAIGVVGKNGSLRLGTNDAKCREVEPMPPETHVTVDSAASPSGAVIEAPNELAALAMMREDLSDWADQVALCCEEVDDAGAQAATAARQP